MALVFKNLNVYIYIYPIYIYIFIYRSINRIRYPFLMVKVKSQCSTMVSIINRGPPCNFLWAYEASHASRGRESACRRTTWGNVVVFPIFEFQLSIFQGISYVVSFSNISKQIESYKLFCTFYHVFVGMWRV